MLFVVNNHWVFVDDKTYFESDRYSVSVSIVYIYTCIFSYKFTSVTSLLWFWTNLVELFFSYAHTHVCMYVCIKRRGMMLFVVNNHWVFIEDKTLFESDRYFVFSYHQYTHTHTHIWPQMSFCSFFNVVVNSFFLSRSWSNLSSVTLSSSTSLSGSGHQRPTTSR